MKSLKIVLASIVLALFVAGCASSSGTSNFDAPLDNHNFPVVS